MLRECAALVSAVWALAALEVFLVAFDLFRCRWTLGFGHCCGTLMTWIGAQVLIEQAFNACRIAAARAAIERFVGSRWFQFDGFGSAMLFLDVFHKLVVVTRPICALCACANSHLRQ